MDKKTNVKHIPYATQWIEDDDMQAVSETLKSDYLTTGPKINEFEQAFAQYVGARYAVAVSSGTAALHAACFAAGIKEGDEVITTPMTFAASANCIIYCGGRPVFADIDPHTYNIDPKEIEKHITPKTKAIIPVHFTGQPCDMDAINDIAKEHHLIVIEDAAHALGATYKSKKIGGISDMTCFSFHPVKHITTGEGGMITTDDENLYKKLIQFRNHGITRDREILEHDDGPWYYEQQFLGYNYRMTDIQAALGISQLKKIDRFLSRRREIADRYDKAFADMEWIITPYQIKEAQSAWHLYILQLKPEYLGMSRKKAYIALQQRGIGVNVHYIPVYYHPYYRRMGYRKGLCQNAENLYERIITIPLYPKMSDEDVEYVIDAVKGDI
ncbi:UDP-4-amino-4,6-dideoxy-N-acetyl-beta-L-altrosamine transaminase [Mahella australiensis]|uniref:UDP-4-keto-6-deoxy-N-acetylglucosamine 4-aminotransferase n=1 Tax=Mahella australiensis (strain DSM 15567 / CIP 107919 / 50-1 BON) TaxID=697281 RepID=F3ZYZ8_MAHA5|nr:UDP-4-amino-4,6-dideoxy-N-acetyl-beta-L-altrosamine transaminase [Mahella australiensis]AEE96757.1 UDP-4-keto-6-deoxy-N-acetylglucosamine 4-aminotransferase [Mahella australiensis 50-1 BON]